jgi:hypothetical protein
VDYGDVGVMVINVDVLSLRKNKEKLYNLSYGLNLVIILKHIERY